MKAKIVIFLCVLAGGPTVVFAQASAGEIYHSDVARKAPSPNESGTPDEKKSIFRSHDNRERVVKEPDKPVQVKKLKYGSDQTEEGGRFKGSMLEEEGDLSRFKKAVTESKNSPAPKASPAEKPSPTPSPTASARPSASP
ncbi:MAG: hypothetical protein QOG48_244 [Verrucomicrobiota bacterium]|jgi:hypothetical protein